MSRRPPLPQPQPAVHWTESTGMVGGRTSTVLGAVLTSIGAGAAVVLESEVQLSPTVLLVAAVVVTVVGTLGAALGIRTTRRRRQKGDDTRYAEPPIRRVRTEGLPSVAVLVAGGGGLLAVLAAAAAAGGGATVNCAPWQPGATLSEPVADAIVEEVSVACDRIERWCNVEVSGETVAYSGACQVLLLTCAFGEPGAVVLVDRFRERDLGLTAATRPLPHPAAAVSGPAEPPQTVCADWGELCSRGPDRAEEVLLDEICRGVAQRCRADAVGVEDLRVRLMPRLRP